MNLNIENNRAIGETKEFDTFLEEFDNNIDFLNSFSDLIKYSGRVISFISNGVVIHLNTILIDNSVQTLKSIKLCCSIGSFTDANTLIRKLRDDLVLFIYILDVINHRKPFLEEDLENLNLDNAQKFAESFLNLRYNNLLTDDEKAVEAWLTNKVLELPKAVKMKLSFENYMKFLKRNQNLNKILIDYNLQEYWETLRNNLNNYIHNNGKQFTSHNLVGQNNKFLEVYLKNINVRTSYITTFFLVALIMTEASLISSTDIIDYLDDDLEPPKYCQYEIANFIQEYIDTYVVKIHPELKPYLRNNNKYGMKIN